MKKSWGLIPKILSGEKTIESRWYQQRRAPWGVIKRGDTIFFKNSGEPVVAKAEVALVHQFELRDVAHAKAIIRKYGKKICLPNSAPEAWEKVPRYVILMELKSPHRVAPFLVRKRGFGSASAWLSMESISGVKVSR